MRVQRLERLPRGHLLRADARELGVDLHGPRLEPGEPRLGDGPEQRRDEQRPPAVLTAPRGRPLSDVCREPLEDLPASGEDPKGVRCVDAILVCHAVERDGPGCA